MICELAKRAGCVRAERMNCLSRRSRVFRLANAACINCVMPCDLRSNTANIALGNHISHLSLKVPMHIEGNIPNLWSFNDITKRLKKNGDYATMYLFNYVSYLLFPTSIGKRNGSSRSVGHRGRSASSEQANVPHLR